MRAVIHNFQDELNQIVAYQCYGTPEPGADYDQFRTVKEWEGAFMMYTDVTSTKVCEIMADSPFQISAHFPKYEGIAHVVGVDAESKTRPIKVSFRGDGILRKAGREIE